MAVMSFRGEKRKKISLYSLAKLLGFYRLQLSEVIKEELLFYPVQKWQVLVVTICVVRMTR